MAGYCILCRTGKSDRACHTKQHSIARAAAQCLARRCCRRPGCACCMAHPTSCSVGTYGWWHRDSRSRAVRASNTDECMGVTTHSAKPFLSQDCKQHSRPLIRRELCDFQHRLALASQITSPLFPSKRPIPHLAHKPHVLSCKAAAGLTHARIPSQVPPLYARKLPSIVRPSSVLKDSG